jgi:hypothetical protein
MSDRPSPPSHRSAGGTRRVVVLETEHQARSYHRRGHAGSICFHCLLLMKGRGSWPATYHGSPTPRIRCHAISSVAVSSGAKRLRPTPAPRRLGGILRKRPPELGRALRHGGRSPRLPNATRWDARVRHGQPDGTDASQPSIRLRRVRAATPISRRHAGESAGRALLRRA